MEHSYTNLGIITAIEIVDQLIYAKVKLIRNDVEIDDILIVSSMGISGTPKVGCHCIVVNTDCDTSKNYGHVIDLFDINSVNDGVVVYGRNGNKVLFMDNGNIDIVSEKNKITLKGDSIEITGNVKITGNLEVSGDSTLIGTGTKIANKTFLSHMHSGVLSGPGSTGGVVWQ